jgi:Tfp pilus assembly protein PilE
MVVLEEVVVVVVVVAVDGVAATPSFCASNGFKYRFSS